MEGKETHAAEPEVLEEKEEEQPDIWVKYECNSIDFGADQSGRIVEASVPGDPAVSL